MRRRQGFIKIGVAIIGAIAFLGTAELGARSASAQDVYTGIAALGLPNWTANDINALGNDLVAVGGNVEVSFLAHEFNPNNPYGNAKTLALSVVPRIQGKLRLVAYLYYDNVFDPLSPSFRWDAFRTSSPNASQSAFRTMYLQRVRAFDLWAADLRAWAQRQRLSAKLDIWLCPYLEDNSGSLTDYNALLNAIVAQQNADRVSTSLRRSPGASIFRPSARGAPIPIEMHGRYDFVRQFLSAGDLYSNIGQFVFLNAGTIPGASETQFSFPRPGDIPIPASTFIFNQRDALRSRISSTLWRPVYPGLLQYPAASLPRQRVGLTPLTAPASFQPERTGLITIVRSR